MEYIFEAYRLYEDVYALFSVDVASDEPLLLAFPITKQELLNKLEELKRNTLAWIAWNYDRYMTTEGHCMLYRALSMSTLTYRKSSVEIQFSRVGVI